MKKTVIAVTVILLLVSFMLPGCKSETETKKYVTEHYTVCINGEECYMQVDDGYGQSTQTGENMELIQYPLFQNLGQMRQAIITGSIPEDELKDVMRNAKRNEDGTIEICNVDNLYECAYPSDLTLHVISWNGPGYAYVLSGDTVSCNIFYLKEDRYYESVNSQYKSFLEGEYITITAQEYEEERSATVYYYTVDSGAKGKYICYEIQKGNNSILVQEEYCIEGPTGGMSHDMTYSDSIPNGIKFWVKDNSAYAYGIMHNFEERPSVEWLSQFGLREYVETEVA